VRTAPHRIAQKQSAWEALTCSAMLSNCRSLSNLPAPFTPRRSRRQPIFGHERVPAMPSSRSRNRLNQLGSGLTKTRWGVNGCCSRHVRPRPVNLLLYPHRYRPTSSVDFISLQYHSKALRMKSSMRSSPSLEAHLNT